MWCSLGSQVHSMFASRHCDRHWLSVEHHGAPAPLLWLQWLALNPLLLVPAVAGT